MAVNKTIATDADVDLFLSQVEHPQRRMDGLRLNEIFQEVTDWSPRMWGPSIVGYGQYHFSYESGRSGEFLATGFSPRKSNLSIYIMPGYADFSDVLQRLGKHKLGKSCLYINKLSDVDEGTLKELIRAGLNDLGKKWPIKGN